MSNQENVEKTCTFLNVSLKGRQVPSRESRMHKRSNSRLHHLMEEDKFQVFSMDKSGMFEIPDNDNAVSKLVQGTGGFTWLTAQEKDVDREEPEDDCNLKSV